MDNDKKLRAKAKSAFISSVDDDIKEIIKSLWKTSYRTGKGFGRYGSTGSS